MKSTTLKGNLKNILTRAGLNGFFVGLVAVVIFASVFSTIGSEAGPLPWQTLIAFGNAFIFSFMG